MEKQPGAVEPRVDELRRMLEQELDVRARSRPGCWPLIVAVVGLLLGIVLLLRGR